MNSFEELNYFTARDDMTPIDKEDLQEGAIQDKSITSFDKN